MNMEPNNHLDNEIEELFQKGWTDFPQEVSGLRIARLVPASEISFPHDAYDENVCNQELSGVWTRWRAKRILEMIRRNQNRIVWEVGSGDGSVAIPLHQSNISVIGIEPLFKGATITAKNGIRTYLGTLESLKLPTSSISAIGAFDVLEHLEEPKSFLAEIQRVLKPGGIFYFSVPAHRFLYSDFDKSIGHYRRYSKKYLYQSLSEVGFRNIKTQFIFSHLVIPALIARKIPTMLGRNRDSKETFKSCNNHYRIINATEPLQLALLNLEKLLYLPFGLTLLGFSRK